MIPLTIFICVFLIIMGHTDKPIWQPSTCSGTALPRFSVSIFVSIF
jgi:hypothetical protein